MKTAHKTAHVSVPLASRTVPVFVCVVGVMYTGTLYTTRDDGNNLSPIDWPLLPVRHYSLIIVAETNHIQSWYLISQVFSDMTDTIDDDYRQLIYVVYPEFIVHLL